jgi:hypothetical protein
MLSEYFVSVKYAFRFKKTWSVESGWVVDVTTGLNLGEIWRELNACHALRVSADGNSSVSAFWGGGGTHKRVFDAVCIAVAALQISFRVSQSLRSPEFEWLLSWTATE